MTFIPHRSRPGLWHTASLPTLCLHYSLKCLLISIEEVGMKLTAFFSPSFNPLSSVDESPSSVTQVVNSVWLIWVKARIFPGLLSAVWQPEFMHIKGKQKLRINICWIFHRKWAWLHKLNLLLFINSCLSLHAAKTRGEHVNSCFSRWKATKPQHGFLRTAWRNAPCTLSVWSVNYRSYTCKSILTPGFKIYK